MDLGEFKVQPRDYGMAAGTDAELAPLVKIVQRLPIIAGDHDLVDQILFGHPGQREFRVQRIIFDQQDAFDVGVHFNFCRGVKK